jgi:phosphoribosylformimino-5-aminoimidazole carboxamide ribotide isomerase
VGGGIRNIDIAKKYFKMGSYGLVIGTMAYKEPDNLLPLIKRYKHIIISIDQRNGIVMIDGWKESSQYGVKAAINSFLEKGVDQFLLTSIERDGTLTGPDIEMLSYACSFPAKIIASGGISNLEDIVKVRNAGAYGVILGKALYDGKIDIKKVKAVV